MERSVCLFLVLLRIEAVPPDACFANFRWDDCGKSPVPVMYYWKPGSRCEVGLWRGCLPNLNMFPDEYECITTCIFTARAMPEDYHSMNENEIEDKTEYITEEATESSNINETTVGNATVNKDGEGSTVAATVVSVTDSNTGGGNTTIAVNNTTVATGGGNTTVAVNNATVATGGGNTTKANNTTG